MDLDIISNYFNDDNNNVGSFYNGIMVFIVDSDNVEGHCIVSINNVELEA